MPDTSLKISTYSFHTPIGGYGILNNNIYKHLVRHGVEVFCSHEFAPPESSNEWLILDEEERNLFRKPFEKQKIGISGTTPFEFIHNQSEVKVAMTMAESDRLGEKWVTACNGMTHVIVPSQFFLDVFRNSGINVPISIIPGGVDTERFPYFEREEKDVFTFGSCGYLNERKGIFELIRAFSSEFAHDEPVKLKLHTSNGFFRYYKDFKDPRITLSWKHKTFDELKDFYNSLDCFVFPSKAEGIGYPPREAMSTGLPTILTNYSGLSDVADPKYAYPLQVKSLTPRKDMLEQPGNWAEIDIAELMYWMRYVYEHQQESREKGKKASETLAANYSWNYCTELLINFLKQYA